MPPRKGRLYIRLDANYRDDEKVASLTNPLAELLWLRGLAWAKARHTDGVLPRSIVVRRLAIDLVADPLELVGELLDAGLWEPVEDGWRVPYDRWAEWQTTNAELDAAAAATRARSERYRKRKARDAASRVTDRDTEAYTRRDATPSHSHSQSQRTKSYVSGTSPSSSGGAGDDGRPDVTRIARQLAELDLERRQAERADEPLRQPARWLTTATNRRVGDDGDRIAELLEVGETDAAIVALLGGTASPAAAARARSRAREARP